MGNFSNHVLRITHYSFNKQFDLAQTVSYINASINTRWHLEKKQGTSRWNPGLHPRTPERTETEFFYKLGFSN